jgi:hypothetical protein
MQEGVARRIYQNSQREDWMKGRSIIVNEDTNTISLFETDEPDATAQRTHEMPLIYEGTAVIPHPFVRDVPPICPIKLNTPTRLLEHGLSNDQLIRLCVYLPGIVTVDYFRDRQVIIRLMQSYYHEAVEKIGGERFRAWNCAMLLVGLSSPGFIEPDQAPVETPGPCLPGCNIYNDDKCSSTLGVFLKPRPRNFGLDATTVQHFTASAHSFLRKKPIELVQMTTAISFALITQFAFICLRSRMLPILLVEQFLFVRVGILLLDILWIYLGCGLKVHTVVHCHL